MFKSSSMNKKISPSELKKMVYELQDCLDPGQRDMIVDMYPNGVLSKIKFLEDMYRLRSDGKLSEVDYKNIKEITDKYWDNYVEQI